MRDQTVWFSSSDQLNDPFDANCRIDTRVSTAEHENLQNEMFNFCFNELQAQGSEESDFVSMFQNPDLSEDLQFWWSCKEFARYAFRNAIYSLTEDGLHPLMWAHYGASYTGYVIEFDTSRKIEPFRYDGPANVQYRESPPHIHIREFFERPGVNLVRLEEFKQQMLLTKAFSWSYEAEWRLIASGSHPGVQTQPYEISRILFGYRMPEEQRKKVLSVVDRNVEYAVVVPNLQSYTLSVIDPRVEDAYMRDFDRSLRTFTDRTHIIGTGDLRRHK